MDPDVTKELEDQLRVLAGLVSQQAAALSGMSASMNQIAGVAAKNNSSLKNLNTSQQKNAESQAQSQAGTSKLQQTHTRYREITESAIDGLSNAAQMGKTAVLNFGSSVLSGQEGFAKYNNAISKVGDAALELGKVFGILGTVVGGIIKIFTKVLEYQTQQADGIFKAYDTVAKMGAAGTITSKEILDMGHGAGLTSLELEKLTEPMKTVRGGFVALGGTQSEGIKKFGEMVAVNESVRREFKRLGMGDQERNQMMADFTSLMNQTGTALSTVENAEGGLQQAALNYARQMYVLADVSGLTVDEAKQKYEAQMATLETALLENKLKQDIMAAQAEYDSATTQEARDAAARKLEKAKKEEQGYKAFNEALMQAGVSQDLIVGAQRQYLSGAINEQSVQFAQWGVDLDSMIAKAKSGELDSGNMAQEIKTGFRQTVNNLGQTTVALDPQTAKNMGLNAEMIRRSTQQATTDYGKTLKDAVGKIAANEAGTGKAATDPAQEARNNLTEAERKLKLKIDSLAAEFNPLLGNMGLIEMFGKAAIAATVVLGAIAAFKLVGAAGGVIKKSFTGLTNVLGFSKSAAGSKSSATAIGSAVSEESSVASAVGKSEDKVVQGIKLASEPKSSVAARILLAAATGLAGMGQTAVPMVVGATKMSAAIVVISGAIGALGALVSKTTMPYIVKGLTRFEKLDGPKIEAIGIGMSGIGAAFAIASGGKLLSALPFFTDMDEETPVDEIGKQALELQDLEIDGNRLATNTSLLMMFSENMFFNKKEAIKMASLDVIKGATEGIVNYFEATPPFEQLKTFAKLNVDNKAVKKNAISFKLFADAMASFEGTGSGLGAIGTAYAEAAAKFYEVRPPLEEAVYFSHLPFNAKRTKNNADAFRMFSEAMSTYKGYKSGLGAVSSAMADAALRYFRVKPPIDQFAAFSALNLDEKKIQSDTTAFLNFATAMSSYTPGPGLLDSISNLFTGSASYFTKGGPVYKFEEFAKMNFVKDKKTGAMDDGLLAQYASSVGTEAFVGESPAREAAENVIDKGKEVATSVFGKLAEGASAVWGAAKGVWDSVKIHNVMKFTGQSGQYENFIALNPPMQQAVLAAATEYKQVTGNKLQMNSGRRKLEDQQRLYDTSVRNGTPGRQPNGRLVAKPNPNAPHIKGNAIDLQQGINDTTRTNQILAKYNLKNKYGARDLPHYDLYAKDGGVFTGPGSGYPIELHGHEVVVPLDTNSLLMKLSQITTDSVEAAKIENVLAGKLHANANFDLYSRIMSQLDEVYSLMDNTHDHDKKMLREELF